MKYVQELEARQTRPQPYTQDPVMQQEILGLRKELDNNKALYQRELARL